MRSEPDSRQTPPYTASVYFSDNLTEEEQDAAVSRIEAIHRGGNVGGFAVAVAIGVEFWAATTALVNDWLSPALAAIGGKGSLSDFTFAAGSTTFHYGDSIDNVISLTVVTIAALLVIGKPFTRAATVERKCPECLSEIPVEARRCAFCTAQVAPA